MKKYVTPSIETYVYNIADIITISGAAEGEVGGDNENETYGQKMPFPRFRAARSYGAFRRGTCRAEYFEDRLHALIGREKNKESF